jgi:hypothetical protein
VDYGKSRADFSGTRLAEGATMMEQRLCLALSAAAMALSLSSAAFAQENEEAQVEIADSGEQEAAQARKRGTHFIGELRLGSTVDGAGSFAYGGALGVGGRWYGLPPIYLFGALDHTSVGRGRVGVDGTSYDEHLSLTGMGLGLRVYVPVYGPFRILGDITVGGLAVETTVSDGSGEWREELWLPYTELGAGPQFRVLHHLSLGARAAIAFVDTSALHRAGPTSAWEGQLNQRTSVLGTVTLHF